MPNMRAGEKNFHNRQFRGVIGGQPLVIGDEIPHGLMVYMLRLISTSENAMIRMYITDLGTGYHEMIVNNHMTEVGSNTTTSLVVSLDFPDGYFIKPEHFITTQSDNHASAYSASIYGYALSAGD
jgi:hypothetical protein